MCCSGLLRSWRSGGDVLRTGRCCSASAVPMYDEQPCYYRAGLVSLPQLRVRERSKMRSAGRGVERGSGEGTKSSSASRQDPTAQALTLKTEKGQQKENGDGNGHLRHAL